MPPTFTLNKSIHIMASANRVWHALTDPELIKVYFFGTECSCDWNKGSPIVFKGNWEGTSYEDKGRILDIEPEKFMAYNYWSSMSGKVDAPENYAEIRYELTPDTDGTTFTVIQHGIATQQALDHSTASWEFILNNLKMLVESGGSITH
jgi:uncharacterized protein YndB with AHSA1/START domain